MLITLNQLKSALQAVVEKMTKISERIPTKVSDLDNDLPSPDWQESDQSSPAYIENRTHWKESGEPVYLIEPQTIDWRSGETPISVGPAYQIPNAGDTVFVSGDECTVTTFGETIQVHNMNKDIYLIFYPDYSVKFAAGSTGTYNVSAQLISETYHKLDNKYLNIDTQLDSTSDNPVANKAVSAVLQGKVSDVQVNGASVVNDGVAEIPIGGFNNFGVFKISQSGGLNIDANGLLKINYATSASIKAGTNNYYPITPGFQHTSAFYGLAKAAGDTTQSQSDNAVGVYTSQAQTAIKDMLGIEEGSANVVTLTDSTITIDGEPNTRYNCGEVVSITINPPAVGTIDVRFTSGSTLAVLTLPSTVKMPEWWAGVETGYTYEIIITDGVYAGVMAWPM